MKAAEKGNRPCLIEAGALRLPEAAARISAPGSAEGLPRPCPRNFIKRRRLTGWALFDGSQRHEAPSALVGAEARVHLLQLMKELRTSRPARPSSKNEDRDLAHDPARFAGRRAAALTTVRCPRVLHPTASTAA